MPCLPFCGVSAVKMVMECQKEGARCRLCSATKELYASQCGHIDPICLNCATKMANNRQCCDTCGHEIRKVIRRYNLKPCLATERAKFVGKFPHKATNSSDAEPNNAHAKYFKKSDKRKWLIHKEGGLKSSKAAKPWVLQHVEDQTQYRGKIQSDPKHFYIVTTDNKRAFHEFTVHPIKAWYDFQKDIKYNTLTLEEAEKEMNGLKRNQQGFGRWIMKEKIEKVERGIKTRLVIDEKEDDEEGNAEEHLWDDENSKKKHKTEVQEEDDDEEEEDNENEDKEINKKTRTNNDIENEDNAKGEEWEHEKDYDDDDDQLKVESPHPSKESESSESVPDHISDFEDDGNINDAGKEMKMLLKKNFKEKDEPGTTNAVEPNEDKEHIKDDEAESNLKDEDVDGKRRDFSTSQIEEKGRKRKLSNDVLQKSNSVSKRLRPDVRSIVCEFFKTGPKNRDEVNKFIAEKVKENLGGDLKEMVKKLCRKNKSGRLILK